MFKKTKQNNTTQLKALPIVEDRISELEDKVEELEHSDKDKEKN
jgi:hypothetical protein